MRIVKEKDNYQIGDYSQNISYFKSNSSDTQLVTRLKHAMEAQTICDALKKSKCKNRKLILMFENYATRRFEYYFNGTPYTTTAILQREEYKKMGSKKLEHVVNNNDQMVKQIIDTVRKSEDFGEIWWDKFDSYYNDPKTQQNKQFQQDTGVSHAELALFDGTNKEKKVISGIAQNAYKTIKSQSNSQQNNYTLSKKQ